MGSKKTIYHNINFIKLILVLVIVYYHIIAGKLSVLYPNVIQFTKMSNKILNTGSYAVVIFFIISGYFLSKSLNGEVIPSFIDFVKMKIIRLFPVLMLSTLMCMGFSYLLPVQPEIETMILNCFFIHNYSGGAHFESWNGASWFVCALFWVSLLYYSIFFMIKDKIKRNFAISLICIFTFLSLITPEWGKGELLRFCVVPYRDLYALYGVGLGCLLGDLKIQSSVEKKSLLNKFLFGILELVTFFLVLLPLYLNANEIKEPLLYITTVCLLLILLVKQQGFFSKFLNFPIFSVISKPSFSIYLMQEVCFVILQASFWKTSYPAAHPVMGFIYSFMFCIFVGILIYKFFEKPVTKFLNNKFKNITQLSKRGG